MPVDQTVPVYIRTSLDNVNQYTVSLSAGVDVTVHTPQSGKQWYLLGYKKVDSSAATVTIKSGSNVISVDEFSANSGPYQAVQKDAFLLQGNPGEAFVIGASSALNSIILIIGEGTSF